MDSSNIGRRVFCTSRNIAIDAFGRHSLSLLLLSLLFVTLGKLHWFLGYNTQEGIAPGGTGMGFTGYVAIDHLFIGILLLMLGLIESVLPRFWMRTITILVAVPVAILSVSNLFWLRGTGSQLSLAVVRIGATRSYDATMTIRDGLGWIGLLTLFLAVGLLVAIPFLVRKQWPPSGAQGQRWKLRLAIPTVLMVIGFVGLAEQMARSHEALPGWRHYADNVVLSVVRDAFTAAPIQDPPTRSTPIDTTVSVLPAAAGARVNVLLVLLEATAWRATSFAPGMNHQTPFLLELAEGGLHATSMRTVMPHTSKSLFSVLCGRYPAMQQEILETADNYDRMCLAEILAQQGYATAFFQSADRHFEDRARLVRNAGYQHFEARQDLDPPLEPLGYLGGDDLGLVQPLLRWTAKQQGPFLATVLTSTAHHPYDLPTRLLEDEELAEAPDWPQSKRYFRIVIEADRVLRQIVEGLAAQGHTDDLMIVVMGDHGEAFGEHGIFQHDNVFWEEGLHVPFVIHHPARIAPGTVITAPRSLIDVSPTILELLGIPVEPWAFDGHSVLSPPPLPDRRYFACWYDQSCVGFVEGRHKLVYLPSARTWLAFDLDTDPDERHVIQNDPAWAEQADEVRKWYDMHRYTWRGLRWSDAPP